METKELFKNFVKNNPVLLKYVKSGEMTWQKFYEMYDMYGEDAGAWSQYLNKPLDDTLAAGTALGIFDFLKNLDLDSIQTGVNSMQRVVSLLQDMSNKNNSTNNEEYKPRPLYKHFED